MISLALSLSKPGLSSDLSETAAPGGHAKGAGGAFSALLAALGTPKAGAEGEIAAGTPSTAQGEEIVTAITSGTVLPVPAESGKSLPGLVPDVAAGGPDEGQDAPAETADQAGSGSDVEADGAAILAALPPLHLPTPPAPTEASEAPLPAARPTPLQPQAGARPMVDAGGAPLLPPQAPAKQPGGDGKTEAPTVALHVAPQADRPSRRIAATSQEIQPVRPREAVVEGILPRAASVDPAPQVQAAASTQGAPAESMQPARAFENARPATQADALQDLTRIVDRLAAAREAFAPAAAALAVKHVEFGELSLRFDQQRDGHLAVQLSASDPEAHRAVAVAVSDRQASSAADSHASTGQQPSQSQARGSAAEREGGTGNGNAARHEQPQQRRSDPQGGEPGTGRGQRSGIFA